MSDPTARRATPAGAREPHCRLPDGHEGHCEPPPEQPPCKPPVAAHQWWTNPDGSKFCIHCAFSMTPTGAARTAETLARAFHEAYERLAPSFGYETRAETRAFDPTTPNGRLMVAVCGEMLSHLAGQAGPEVRGLVDAYRDALDEVMAHGFGSPDIMLPKDRERQREAFRAKRERLAAAETALLAAYAAKDAEAAALRQQRDEAERVALTVCPDAEDEEREEQRRKQEAAERARNERIAYAFPERQAQIQARMDHLARQAQQRGFASANLGGLIGGIVGG